MEEIQIEEIKTYLLQLQKKICDVLSHEDGQGHFIEDKWHRENGGGEGITCVMENGKVIEKAGVNFSHVSGDQLPSAATLNHPELAGRNFQALGISVIVHPTNPFVPTVHLNVRFFCAMDKINDPVWWFGGGFDLTPYYGFDEDCIHWHRMAYQACKPFGETVYPHYKKLADDYFFLKHRQEPRGIGGIFFDDLHAWGFDKCFAFMKSVGDHFLLAYQPIMARRKNTVYGKKERDFQCYRRGRYVEFNLLYDRGTLFGLQFKGRIESILVSLPPQVNFYYNRHPEKGTAEAMLYEKYLLPTDWLNA